MAEFGFDLNQAVVLKHENLFLLTEPDGSMPGLGRHPFGLFYDDCRFLSGWRLELLGERPRPLVCSATTGHSSLHELTNHELELERGARLAAQTLQVSVARELVLPNLLEERITLASFARTPIAVPIRLWLCASFEPMMWIRGLVGDFQPNRPITTEHPGWIESSVVGHDGVERALVTETRPRPRAHSRGGLEWNLRVSPRRTRTIALRHAVFDTGGRAARRPRAPSLSPPNRRGRRGHPTDAVTRVRSDSPLFDRIVERSLADLRMLRSRYRRESYFAGGIPWYATVFGRDTLITAMEMLAYQPAIAEGTLRMLARRLGQRCEDARDEEPGKVIHELRVGEVAHLGVTPFAEYYGSVDSTPLFLCLLAEHADWSGSLALFEELSEEVQAALLWLGRYGDLDGDGLIEYRRRAPEGLENQGWKDSHDGIPDEHGRPLQAPIALVEVQGYAILATRRLARLYERSGDARRAEALRRQATALGERLGRFWLESQRSYAIALDARKRPSRVLASNQGHLLWTMAVPPRRAAAIRRALMGPRMFCGWGIRTLAEGEAAYNPIGYHTGSVWPHDCALIARGLRWYGYDADFARIFEGLLQAASQFPDYRLPELFAGFAKAQYEVPVPYPVACHPQAWAAASIPYLLVSALGLLPDALDGKLRIVRPLLPAWVTRLELQGMRVGRSRVDVLFERVEGAVTVADVRVDGDLDVILDLDTRPRAQLDAEMERLA